MKNPSAHDVEIYSLEFDRQYMKEEAALSAIESWDSKGRVFLPARNAGEPLPAELYRWADAKDKAHLNVIHVGYHAANGGNQEEGGDGSGAGGDAAGVDNDAVAHAQSLTELNAALSVDPIEAANDRATGEDVRKAR